MLISSKDGQVIRNLTKGFDKDSGYEYIATAGGLRGNLVPWIAWAPVGDRIAYFARTEKHKTLVLQNVATGEIERRFELADDRRARVAGLQPGRPRRRVRRPAGGGRRHLHDRRRDRRDQEHHQGHDCRLRAHLLARRQDDRLHGARSAATTSSSRSTSPTGAKKQLTFGSARRHGGEVLQRPDCSCSRRRRSDPTRADAAGSGAQRQHPEHLDARPAARVSCGSGPTR